LFLLICVLGIGVVGYSWYQNQILFASDHVQNELSAAVNLKAEQIATWRERHAAIVSMIFADPFLQGPVREWMKSAGDETLRKDVAEWAGALRQTHSYKEAILLSADGRVRLEEGSKNWKPSPADLSLMELAVKSRRAIFGDLQRTAAGSLRLHFVIPLVDPKRASDPVCGAMFLGLDPADNLFPMLAPWPTRIPGAEFVLARKDGQALSYLNPLRNAPDTALNLRRPMSDLRLPEVRAAQGKEGFCEGIDYAGTPVLAASRAIPGCAWVLAAKVDRDEILQDVRNQSKFALFAVPLLVLSGIVVVLHFMRRDQAARRRDAGSQAGSSSAGAAAASIALHAKIEERKRVEGQLHLQSVALESAANAIVVTDREGNILWANPAFKTLTGYTLHEVMGRNLRLLKSEQQDGEFYRQMWETIKAGQVWRGELINRRKDGTLYTEEMTITPVNGENGEIANYVAVKNDRTHEKELQLQLFQAQKMESIGRLAGGIAHDFNNLLQAIMGFSDLLMSELDEQDGRREDVRQIQEAARRAVAMTRQLLSVSRKQKLEMRIVDVNALVDNMQVILRRLIGEDIQLTANLATHLRRVQADPGQIEQIVLNLCLNARDAMPKGGRITIATEEVVLEAQDAKMIPDWKPGRFVLLSVTDSGLGMSKETLQKIFEPFFTTKAAGKGTGLGLATCYGIAKQHDGWLQVYSEVGQGSTFKLFLPVLTTDADLEDPTSATPLRNAMRGQGQRILVVEDDFSVRSFATRVLRSSGYTVFSAASGWEAGEIFERERGDFDMLFSDVVLPDRNGMELVDDFIQQDQGLRVLLTSGYTDEKARWPEINARGFMYLLKPYPSATLVEKIWEVLQQPPAVELAPSKPASKEGSPAGA
jgi:PAS domain S-box-containing protein